MKREIMVGMLLLPTIPGVTTCPLPHIVQESAPTFTTDARVMLETTNLARKAKLTIVIITGSMSALEAIRNLLNFT